jgi:hypothetical protein
LRSGGVTLIDIDNNSHHLEAINRVSHGLHFNPHNHFIRIDFEAGAISALRKIGYDLQYCMFHKNQVRGRERESERERET